MLLYMKWPSQAQYSCSTGLLKNIQVGLKHFFFVLLICQNLEDKKSEQYL